MAHRVTKRRKAVLSGGLHPHYVEVVKTLSAHGERRGRGAARRTSTRHRGPSVADRRQRLLRRRADAGRVRQRARPASRSPTRRTSTARCSSRCSPKRCRSACCKSPGAMGADIVVGEGQSIGNALNFGGPYVGLFATRSKYVRQMPGRLCGETVDADGQARLRADAVDPRAAHPPRQGDLEHLHQFGPVLPRLHDPHDAARRGGPAAPRAHQPRQRREAGGRARRACQASRC